MTINADFFKTTRKIAQKKLFLALNKGKKFLVTLLQNGVRFFGTTYERLVVRGEYAKRDFIVLFIAAVLLGIAFKSVATETITIGFEDYTLAPEGTLYDLNVMQKNLIERDSIPVSGGAPANMCSE